jgi:hypothetical protein
MENKPLADALIGPKRGWPRWANTILLWLGVPTGLILAVLAFGGALDNGFQAARSVCESVGLCASQKIQKVAPVLPNFVSSRVDGGHGYREFCEPVAQTYREQYPDFTITWHEAGDGRDKDWLGHATYQYTCTFSAAPKG